MKNILLNYSVRGTGNVLYTGISFILNYFSYRSRVETFRAIFELLLFQIHLQIVSSPRW